MRRRGAAAAAEDVHAVLDQEALGPAGELLRAERVAGLAVDQLRQPGVGLHREEARPVLGQPLEVRRHLLRRSEEHTSELQSLMRISYAVFCLKKKNTTKK